VSHLAIVFPASLRVTVSEGLFDDDQGTARLLSACKSQAQALEAAKNLLLGNLRVDMLR
jgi:hypothetical protein